MDILLSSVEYNTFVSLMKLMRPVALHRLKQQEAEAKTSNGGREEGKSPSKSSAKDADDFDNGYNDRADSKYDDRNESDGKLEKMSK
jgi:hypothetical protein